MRVRIMKSADESADDREDIFCIHGVKIPTQDPHTQIRRSDCRKCRKNYYRILNMKCPHYKKRIYCDFCDNVDGWCYEKES